MALQGFPADELNLEGLLLSWSWHLLQGLGFRVLGFRV